MPRPKKQPPVEPAVVYVQQADDGPVVLGLDGPAYYDDVNVVVEKPVNVPDLWPNIWVQDGKLFMEKEKVK